MCKAQGIPNNCPVLQNLIKFGEYACQPIIHHSDSNCSWCNRTVIYFAFVAIFFWHNSSKRGGKCSYRYFLTYHSPSKSWINQSATAVARIISGLILIAARCDVRWIHYCKTQQSLNDTHPLKVDSSGFRANYTSLYFYNYGLEVMAVTSNSIHLVFKPYNRRRPTIY